MDFQQLQALGGIVPTALIKKQIEFTRPRTPEEGEGEPITETAEICIRKRDSRDFIEINRATEADRLFVALFRSVCTPDGSPLFPSADDAGRLADWLLGPLLSAMNEVNAFAPKILTAEDELWHRLALALGGRSVREWQLAIDEEERSAWLAYERKHGPVEPLKRLDVVAGMLAAQVMNASDKKKAGGGHWVATDFILRWGEPEEEVATIEDVMTMLTRARVK